MLKQFGMHMITINLFLEITTLYSSSVLLSLWKQHFFTSCNFTNTAQFKQYLVISLTYKIPYLVLSERTYAKRAGNFIPQQVLISFSTLIRTVRFAISSENPT